MKGIEGSKLGRYELRCRIAQGGMSEVYLGYDRRVRRWVAVKVLYGSDEPFVRRFEREALAVGALSHEHILPLYDFGEQRPWYYLVMPYVEGGTLRDYLLKREQLSLDEAGSFLEQIASSLQHAHDHGVIHRDVKPSNILLRPDGHVYLADFGLAKAKIETASLVNSGAMVGTPEYMAPEQSNGEIDYRSDIYSLGIILYQMLAGCVPFTAESPVAVTLKHIQSPPPSPIRFNAAIPQKIEDVILTALAKNPEERYQQARALSTAYSKALRQEREARHEVISQLKEEKGLPGIQDIDTIPSIIAPLLTPGSEISTKPPLFPVGYNTSIRPQVVKLYKNKPRLRPLHIILLGLTLLLIVIPLSVLWAGRTQPKQPPIQITPRIHSQQRATATMRATNNAQATLAAEARVQATAGITAALGAGPLLYYDDMQYSGNGWIDDGKQCYFSTAGYHVSTHLSHAVAWCYTNQQAFSNFVMTTQAQLVRGNFYGLVFRLNPHNKAFYVLEINSQRQYRFQRALGNDPGKWLTLIDWTISQAINVGYKNINTFLVVASGASFSFYMNQQLLVSVFTDSTYNRGLIGLLVGEDNENGTDAIFTHVGIFQK